MIAFVPKDFAIKMNLLLYRILNEQTDMQERSCCLTEAILTNIQSICFFKVLNTNSCIICDELLSLKRRFHDSQIVILMYLSLY